MVGVEAPAVAAPAPRSGFERPALIAAVVGAVVVAVLVFVRPDPAAVDVGSSGLDVPAPQAIAVDGPALGPTAIAAPGTGRYPAQLAVTIEGTNTGGTTTSDRTISLQVEDVAGGQQEGVAYRTISTPGPGVDQVLAFRADGVYIMAVGSLDGCVLDAPVKVWTAPMAVGDAWSGSSSCTGSGNIRSAHVAVEARVIGTKTVTIGTDTVDGFVVESTRRTEQTVAFRSNENTTNRVEKRVEVVAPALGLPVLANSSAETASGGATEQTTAVTSELTVLSTTPQVAPARGPRGRQGGDQ